MAKNKLSKYHKWAVGIGITALIIAALGLGINYKIKNAIDFSVINGLGHYQKASTNRSADVTIPAQVTDTNARLIIEITHPQLILAEAPPDPVDDNADVWFLYGMSPAPCASLEAFMTDASLIDEIYMQGIEYRTYTDTRVGIYNTHFYYVWEGHPELMENIVYAIYIDFIDADSTYHFEEELLDEGIFPEIDIFGTDRPNSVFGSPLHINAYVEIGDEKLELLAIENSPYLSFFLLDTTVTDTETITQTDTGTQTGNGIALGSNTVLIAIISIAAALGLSTCILVIILVVKKKK